MRKFDISVRLAITLATLAVLVLSISALISKPLSSWPIISISVFLALMAMSTLVLLRHPDWFFAHMSTLFSTLVIGRLFSTMRFEGQAGPALNSLDPLLVAETGPGIPSITYATTILAILLALSSFQLILKFHRNLSLKSFFGNPTINDWGLTIVRIYVGLMLIAHFAGHLFAGPIPFNVFTKYFSSIHLQFPGAMVILAGLIELAVSLGLVFGFMTRLAALAGAIYLFVAVGLGGHFSVGYVWVLPTGGWEFPAFWIFIISIFVFVGGGPISIDNWLKQRFPNIPKPIRNLLS